MLYAYHNIHNIKQKTCDNKLWDKQKNIYFARQYRYSTINLHCIVFGEQMWKILQNKLVAYPSIFHQGSAKNIVFTRGQFWPSGIVIACVCVYVCVSVNHELSVR